MRQTRNNEIDIPEVRQTSSGWGRLFLDPSKQNDDLRLWRRAIRQRWNIGDDFRGIAVDRIRKIIESTEDDELALKAIAEVRHLEAQNQKDQHKAIDVHVSTRSDELPGIAAALGIDYSVVLDAERQAGRTVGDPEEAGAEESDR